MYENGHFIKVKSMMLAQDIGAICGKLKGLVDVALMAFARFDRRHSVVAATATTTEAGKTSV